jgi:hypothetical protein
LWFRGENGKEPAEEFSARVYADKAEWVCIVIWLEGWPGFGAPELAEWRSGYSPQKRQNLFPRSLTNEREICFT